MSLNQAERDVFNDKAIEAAYQAWVEAVPGSHNQSDEHMRKQFLLRVRSLMQAGAV